MQIEVYYRAHQSSRAILEPSPPRSELGGTFWVFLHNPKRIARNVSAIVLNDIPADSRTNGNGLNWFRLMPEPIPPRGSALLILNAQASLLRQSPLKFRLILADGERHEWILPIEPSPLTLTSAWLEGMAPAEKHKSDTKGADRVPTQLTVVVRNDDPQRVWQIEQLRVQGKPLRFRTPESRLAPGELAFLHARLPFEPEPSQILALQVDARAGQATTMTAGVVRPLPRFFPIGTWRTEVWQDENLMRELVARGFDTFVFSDTHAEVERRAFEQTCPQLGVKALVFAGFPRPDTRFIERHAHNPHIIAYMIKDEPDWTEPREVDHWHLPTLCERVAQVFRDRQVSSPVYLNLARSRRFGEFATIPDIACYDAYRVGAPMPDLSPAPWGNLLELAATYTEDLRANCEPLPFWVWAQGAHPWDERVWVEGQLGRACPTPEEIRVQLWLQLGRGAKGVLWFTTFLEEPFRRYYMQRLRPLPESERSRTVEQLVAHGREAYEEQTRLNRFLKTVREWLLRMEWAGRATVEQATEPKRLDASLLLGEHEAALWLTNLAYEMHPQGYRFREQRAIRARIPLPRWWKPRRALWIDPTTQREIPFQRVAEGVVIAIDTLPEHVGSAWLFRD
ncbi:hypothetical protein HRbin15_01032 [bacterium HR15]|nr:hypothetical protein HRbin15_01032 [bacterium HR15]